MRCSPLMPQLPPADSASPISSRMVNSLPTSASALSLQDPNQSTTQRLNRAGLVVDRFFHSPPLGFIVNTTWRLRCTIDVKRRYNSSSLSIITPSRAAESRQALISAVYSSPSNRPGTSPLASTAFIASRKPLPRTLPSSKMKQIFSPSTPTRFITLRRSSLKSSMSYRECALIWNIASPFIQETNFDRTVFPAPLSPTNNRWPIGWRRTLSIRST
mmetsp:Transcript_35205/g.84097  ORF Transcript_35205/g.84097 Transcript_35205/m.84097 type:complete len:216 (-) Transcript_35205:4019-4666(-)